MDSCPKELEPYDIAHKKQIEEKDMLMHAWLGNYGVSALGVAISHCFSKNASSKYIEKPIFSKIKEETQGLDENEKQRQTEQFFMQLNIMGANFNLNKDSKGS